MVRGGEARGQGDYGVAGSSDAVAFCGTRGVPANYGGFETAVDEISIRFARRGYDCVVFNRVSRGSAVPESHEGRRLVYVEGSRKRSLETFVSSLQTGWHLLRNRKEYRYAFWFNNANLPGILLTRLAGIPLSVNLDGLEWRRAKWSWPFKAYYFLSSAVISRTCPSLIADSRAIQAYYKKTFRADARFIPYGVPPSASVSREKKQRILREYGVSSGRYFLQITRFEPDNLPLEVAEAFLNSRLAKEGFKLLLVGYQQDTPYARRISAVSREDGVLVAHAVFDLEVLSALREDCFCYVHGNSVGGTNPALLEAMALCPRVLAIEGPFSREVLGETGYFFVTESLAASLRGVLDAPDRSGAMQARVRERYRWEAVAEEYAELVEDRTYRTRIR